MTGDLMTVSRMRIGTDGNGITTLVTFFGCPLHCKYCINNFCHGGNLISSGLVHRGTYTPEQIIEILNQDDIYYRMSGGGVTFGGGEPLLQSAFIHEVCKLSIPQWKMRVETSLNIPWRYIEPVVDDFDEWIIDIKDMNPRIYQNYTGVSNDITLDNLFHLKNVVDKSKLHIRIPRIPGFNDENDVKESVKEIHQILDVEPEVFDYIWTSNADK